MSFLRLGPLDGLFYQHHLPADTDSGTFVFFNALTGDTTNRETVICPTLRDAGCGTLTYNMRGQTDSPFSPEVEFTEKQIVSDASKLLPESILPGAERPPKKLSTRINEDNYG